MPRLPRPALLLPALAVTATFALTACGNGGVAEESREHTVETGANGQAGDVKVLDATLSIGLTPTEAALSVTVYDQGQAGDVLTGVSSPMAADFTLPGGAAGASTGTATTGAAATTSTVPVPAMGAVTLAETTAIGVSGLTGSPQIGNSVPVTFTFLGAGPITLDVPVVGSDQPGPTSTPTPAVTGANVDGGDDSPAVSPAAS